MQENKTKRFHHHQRALKTCKRNILLKKRTTIAESAHIFYPDYSIPYCTSCFLVIDHGSRFASKSFAALGTYLNTKELVSVYFHAQTNKAGRY